MELEYINIRKNPSYHARAGEYTGTLKYEGEYGTIELPMDAQLSAEVLKLVAESLTRATKELANTLTASVFEQAKAPLLEQKDE